MCKRIARPALSCTLCCGCALVGAGSPQGSPSRVQVEQTSERVTPASHLRSARFVHEGGDEDELLLVFDGRVDPLGLQWEDFVVVRGDGRRIFPRRATLAPADELDEHRSVTLVGDFGDGEARALEVIGGLHLASGEVLEGTDAEIAPLAAADTVVGVEWLEPRDARCPGAGAVLRLYWTDRLGPLPVEASRGFALEGDATGTLLHPASFDDQAHRSGDDILAPADDNVLDLCFERRPTGEGLTLRIEAGATVDAGGRPVEGSTQSLPSP